MIRNNIKKLRRSRKMSQRQLAEIIGVTQNNISAWELGKTEPSEENVCDLSNLFCVSASYVLGMTTNPYEDVGVPMLEAQEPLYASDFNEKFILQTYRFLPEQGKEHLLMTAHLLEKYYND